MGYYWCRKCDDLFQIKYREQPVYCKNCKTVKYLRQIQRFQYNEWQKMKTDYQTWKELQDDKKYEYCRMIWDAYDTKNKSRSI